MVSGEGGAASAPQVPVHGVQRGVEDFKTIPSELGPG